MKNFMIIDEDRYNHYERQLIQLLDFVVVQQADGRYRIVKSRWCEPGDKISKSLLDYLILNT